MSAPVDYNTVGPSKASINAILTSAVELSATRTRWPSTPVWSPPMEMDGHHQKGERDPKVTVIHTRSGHCERYCSHPTCHEAGGQSATIKPLERPDEGDQDRGAEKYATLEEGTDNNVVSRKRAVDDPGPTV